MEMPHVVVTDIPTGEGPCWRADTRELVVTSVAMGEVYIVDVATGTKRLFADTGGGPNSAVLCSDGGALITQNGGCDWTPIANQAPFAGLPVARWRDSGFGNATGNGAQKSI